MVIDAFGGWVFTLNEGFLGYILSHIFMGMLSILLHVDFKCLLRSIMGYVETIIFIVASFRTHFATLIKREIMSQIGWQVWEDIQRDSKFGLPSIYPSGGIRSDLLAFEAMCFCYIHQNKSMGGDPY